MPLQELSTDEKAAFRESELRRMRTIAVSANWNKRSGLALPEGVECRMQLTGADCERLAAILGMGCWPTNLKLQLEEVT